MSSQLRLGCLFVRYGVSLATVVGLLAITSRAQAGYPDGMNTYAGYHIMHGGVDPMGLKFDVSFGAIPPVPQEPQPVFNTQAPIRADRAVYSSVSEMMRNPIVWHATPRARHALGHFLSGIGGESQWDVVPLYQVAAQFRRELTQQAVVALWTMHEVLDPIGQSEGLAGTRLVGQWTPGIVTQRESVDWFLAFRGFSFIVEAKGYLTQSRPCCVDITYRTTVAKQYNFDAGDRFPGGILPNGTQMQRLHKTGLARNFLIWGRMTTGNPITICFTTRGRLQFSELHKLGQYVNGWQRDHGTLDFASEPYSR